MGWLRERSSRRRQLVRRIGEAVDHKTELSRQAPGRPVGPAFHPVDGPAPLPAERQVAEEERER
jgi:hypothetical protein